MDNFDNILNQLKDSSGELKDNLHIMEDIVPIEEQMKYFEYSNRTRAEHPHENRNRLIGLLFSPDVDIETKRYCLSILAGMVDIAAYRALETYHSSPLEPELAHWAALAHVESRILLDSELSGEQQFFVSTGLGGVDGKLRFFAIVASKDKSAEFTDLQKEIIDREFKFRFEHDNIIAEEFEIKENYVKILFLADLKHNTKSIFQEIITECNALGDFLDEKFMLTNVKRFTDSEIEKILTDKDNPQ
ncbi:MAG: hypothetical protein ACLVKO_12475 [Dysgonomonas sp.]